MLPYIIVILILILIVTLLFYSRITQTNTTVAKFNNEPTIVTGKPCPICQSLLQKNQRVHSYRFTTGDDTLMHIFGCPFCYKDHPKSQFNSSTIRKCPSCKKSLNDKEFVIARLFEKPGKNHVHVLGCYRCRGKR